MSTKDEDAKPSVPTKPWASGRVLSAEQRERKRQANRNSNRFVKTELQSRMHALENRVMQLEQWRLEAESAGRFAPLGSGSASSDAQPQLQPSFANSSDHQFSRFNYDLFNIPALDAAAQSPYNTLGSFSNLPSNSFGAGGPPLASADALDAPMSDDARTNVDFGSDFLNQRNNIPGDLGSAAHYPPRNVTSLKSGLAPTLSDSDTAPSIDNSNSPGWANEGLEQSGDWLAGNSSTTPTNTSSAPDSASQTLALVSAPEVAPHPPLLDQNGRDITEVCNNLVRYVRSLTPNAVCLNDTYNQDVIIRAVVNGWDDALSRYPVICPLWHVIRFVDYHLFRRCNINERICVLRILHQMYFYEILRNSKYLPPWYKPRPSQQYLEHEEVVDHLAWPGLRERLSIAENNTLTNRFWYAFGHNFRFIWPRSPLDAFHLRPGTPHYQLSADFAACMQDIGRYRMRADFFAQFPLLYDDIGPAEYLPLTWVRPAPEEGGGGEGVVGAAEAQGGYFEGGRRLRDEEEEDGEKGAGRSEGKNDGGANNGGGV